MQPPADDASPAPPVQRRKLRRIPGATCRIQLTRDSDFAAVASAVPYLARLGITHLYLSPLFRSRAGSVHGYDVTNHAEVNPELGGMAGLLSLVEVCHGHAMGILLDIVPNHMAVMTCENVWWMDVLENGPSSRYAGYFDIDWNPARQSMRNRLLVPALERPLGDALAQGDVSISFDADRDALRVTCGSLRFPVAQATRPVVLRELEGGLLDRCDPAERTERLARILAAQPYRLAYWRVAGEEVNYRRFFDVNDLAALRVEDPEVFERTHGLVRELWRQGCIDGVRVDHADGLFRPVEYLHRLQDFLAGGDADRPWVVVEKILAQGEELPGNWLVDGTTGYEFGALLAGWLLHPQGVQHLDRIHRQFVHPSAPFAQVAYESRKRVMHSSLAAEVTMLAQRLDRIAQASYGTQDFTLFDLRQAVVEVIASFPVYRTYIAGPGVGEADAAIIRRAVGTALGRKQASRRAIEYLRAVLLGEEGMHERLPAALDFCLRFQQVTGPVMAKGMEDTAFYRHSRLLVCNEVGADPLCRGVSTETFHRANEARAQRFPWTLLATSTHDSKRGEDPRFRLCVLSEVAEEWRRCLGRWRRLKRRAKRAALPGPEMEYLLLQTALSIWPVAGGQDADLSARLAAYAVKAAREAKEETSWLDPDAGHEELLQGFVRLLVPAKGNTGFPRYFAPVLAQASYFGALNSIVAVVLKLTVPGVPDIYQGNETLRHVLVDPDNRGAVDMAALDLKLAQIEQCVATSSLAEVARALLAACEDGRLKTFVTWRLLRLRREEPELFSQGGYLPVPVQGRHAEHLMAYQRVGKERSVLVVAARWLATFAGGGSSAPSKDAWEENVLVLPAQLAGGSYRDVLTGQWTAVPEEGGEPRLLHVPDLLGILPVAVLVRGDGAD